MGYYNGEGGRNEEMGCEEAARMCEETEVWLVEGFLGRRLGRIGDRIRCYETRAGQV